MRRRVYRIAWDARARRWVIRGPAAGFMPFRTKAAAVDVGVEHCRFLLDLNLRSQLVIHRRDGTIESERTYGADPKRTKG